MALTPEGLQEFKKHLSSYIPSQYTLDIEQDIMQNKFTIRIEERGTRRIKQFSYEPQTPLEELVIFVRNTIKEFNYLEEPELIRRLSDEGIVVEETEDLYKVTQKREFGAIIKTMPKNSLPKKPRHIANFINRFNRSFSVEEQSMLLTHLEQHAVLFGSRALDLANDTDYDYAITYEDLISLPPSITDRLMKYFSSNPNEYFKRQPEHGFKGFISKLILKEIYCDILILHTEEDLDTVQFSIQDLQQIPKYLLEDKETRIKLYQRALQEYGWITDIDASGSRRRPNTAVTEAPIWEDLEVGDVSTADRFSTLRELTALREDASRWYQEYVHQIINPAEVAMPTIESPLGVVPITS